MTRDNGPEKPRPIPAGARLHGRLAVPPSKSLTHRYLNLALLSGRETVLERPLLAEDTRLFLDGLTACGWRVVERGHEEVLLAPPPRIAGRGQGEGSETEIFCGNAGTMLRFLVAALAVLPGRWRLDGVPRLRQRPVGPLVDALRRLGCRIHHLGAPGFAPLSIAGGTLQGGATTLAAEDSSQYLSALLMAALAAPAPVTVEVTGLTSEPYVAVTLAAISRFGGRVEEMGARGSGSPRRVWRIWPGNLGLARAEVEGDVSAACYAGAGAALTGGRVVLSGLSPDSRQGDLGFFELLRAMGAEVAWEGADLAVKGRGLRGLQADLSSMPDQVPTLAALAPFASGETKIVNVKHLRLKESDRLEAMATELGRLGAHVEEGADWLRISGIWAEVQPPVAPVVVDPRGDHRIAMSLALAGLRRPGISVGSPQVVAKSYPGFWQDFDSLLQA